MVKYVISVDDVRVLRLAMLDKRNAGFFKRLEAVALRGEFGSNEVVGSIVDVSPVLVSRWVSAYCRGGLNALLVSGRPRSVGVADEEEFVALFKEAVGDGLVRSVEDFAAIYSKRTGRRCPSKAVVCAILRRHGWRYVRAPEGSLGEESDRGVRGSFCWMPPV